MKSKVNYKELTLIQANEVINNMIIEGVEAEITMNVEILDGDVEIKSSKFHQITMDE